MTTPKQVLIDTNVLVALVDTRDTWHASAQAVREALKTTATSLVYCDPVLNEAISVLARRAQEQRRANQFAGLVHTLLHEVPIDIIVWLSSETQRLYDQVIEWVQSTAGDLNFHDALITLGCRLLSIEVIASFDRDFDQVAWLIRVDTSEAVMALFAIEACYGASMVYLRQGEVQRAIPMLERAMGLCQDWPIPLLWPGQATALGLAYALEGRVAARLALVEQGVEQTVARGRSRRLASMVAWLSEASLLADRLEDAHTHAAQAVDLARQYKQRGTQAWALWLLGESTARQASPAVEPAVGHYRQALALAEELGMRPLQAHCHRGLGTLYARQGLQEQARAALSTAIALYRAMDMRLWLLQAEATLREGADV